MTVATGNRPTRPGRRRPARPRAGGAVLAAVVLAATALGTVQLYRAMQPADDPAALRVGGVS
jgi:hypothetical protein